MCYKVVTVPIEGSAVSTPTDPLLMTLRAQGPLSKSQLAEALALSRSATSKRIERFVARGVIKVIGQAPSTGGRPADLFGVNDGPRVLAIADIAGSSFRVALANTRGEVLASAQHDVPVSLGPKRVLAAVEDAHQELVRSHFQDHPGTEGARHPDDRRPRLSYGWAAGIAVSVPGPIDDKRSLPTSPPIMLGWENYDVLGYFRTRSEGVPLYLDNDANAMAYAEFALEYPDSKMLYMIKAGTGIGSAIISEGNVVRGSHGAAGDIGHTAMIVEPMAPGAPLPQCRCGNSGCVEAFSGGWALVRRARELGLDVEQVADLVACARASDPVAVRLIRAAGRHLGHVIVAAVGLLNPDVVVVNGQLTEAADHLLVGIMESVYASAQPLASRRLVIETGTLGPLAGVLGLARLLVRELPAPGRRPTVPEDAAMPRPERSRSGAV